MLPGSKRAPMPWLVDEKLKSNADNEVQHATDAEKPWNKVKSSLKHLEKKSASVSGPVTWDTNIKTMVKDDSWDTNIKSSAKIVDDLHDLLDERVNEVKSGLENIRKSLTIQKTESNATMRSMRRASYDLDERTLSPTRRSLNADDELLATRSLDVSDKSNISEDMLSKIKKRMSKRKSDSVSSKEKLRSLLSDHHHDVKKSVVSTEDRRTLMEDSDYEGSEIVEDSRDLLEEGVITKSSMKLHQRPNNGPVNVSICRSCSQKFGAEKKRPTANKVVFSDDNDDEDDDVEDLNSTYRMKWPSSVLCSKYLRKKSSNPKEDVEDDDKDINNVTLRNKMLETRERFPTDEDSVIDGGGATEDDADSSEFFKDNNPVARRNNRINRILQRSQSQRYNGDESEEDDEDIINNSNNRNSNKHKNKNNTDSGTGSGALSPRTFTKGKPWRQRGGSESEHEIEAGGNDVEEDDWRRKMKNLRSLKLF